VRKDQVLRFCGDDDEGMIHSILTGLPTFTEYSDVHSGDQALPYPEPAATVPEHSPETSLSKGAEDALLTHDVSKSACNASEPDLYIDVSLPSSTPGPLPGPLVATAAVCSETGTSLTERLPPRDEGISSIPAVDDPLAPLPSQPGIFIYTARSAPASSDPADIPLPPSAASTPPASPTHAESSHFQTGLSLLNVLLLADDLFVRFPPSTPDLCLARTLGPASAMRTWAEKSALLPSDDQAEALVVAGNDIVVREVEPASLGKEPRQKARRGETQLLVVGALLVLGAAVAIGVSSHGGGREVDWSALFDTLGAVGERMLGGFGDVGL
jgi:TBC1 domain family member 20